MQGGDEQSGEINLWNIASVSKRPQFEDFNSSRITAFSPDHSVMIYPVASTLILVDLKNGNSFPPIDGQPIGYAGSTFSSDFAYTPDGKYFITANESLNNILLWEAATRKLLYSYEISGEQLEGIAISPDSQTMAVVSQGKVKLVDMTTWSITIQFDIDIERGYMAAFTADGQRLVILDHSGNASVWNATSGQELNSTKIPNGMVKPVALSANATWMAVIVDERELQVWNIETGKEVWAYTDSGFSDISFDPWNFTFSPDGNLFAFPTGDYLLAVRETVSGKQLNIPEDLASLGGAVVFSPDGRLLAVNSDGGLTFWSVK